LPTLPKLGHGPPPNEFQLGANQVTIGVRHHRPYKPGADIQIEKVEVAVKYRKAEAASAGRLASRHASVVPAKSFKKKILLPFPESAVRGAQRLRQP
jgi:acyl dehydratase